MAWTPAAVMKPAVFYLLVILLLAMHAPRGDAAPATAIELTEMEQQRLRAIGNARVCVDPHYAPFEQLDPDGQYRGIAADFLEYYSATLALPMTVQRTGSWAESLRWMQQGRCDLIAMLNETDSRRAYMDFTLPYLQDDTLIITRDDVGYLDGLSALRGKQVGVVPGYRVEELIQRDYPDIELVPTASIAEALQRVSSGELYATFEALRSALPLIQQQGLGNLKISGQTPYQNIYRIGVRKGDTQLLSALNKAISAMPPVVAHEIVERGFRVPVIQRTDYTRVWQMLVGMVLLSALLLYRHYKVRQFNRQLADKNVELEQLSETDHLTGCYNRLKLDKELAEEVARAQRYQRPLTVVLFDLDWFKQINDQHGHQTGDQVLVHVAALIRQHIRQQDRCGRWGGEEFLILCPETTLEQGAALAEKLRHTLAEQRLQGDIQVTGSFGVASLRTGESIGSLIRRVDQAQYDAKHQGRNRLCVAD